MENASKALIIAGAILISIVIISLGIIVINNVRGTAINANINSEEAQAFNGKFNLGQHLTGAQVNSILQTVIATNGANVDDTDYTAIEVIIDSTVDSGDYIGGTSDSRYATFNSDKYFNVTATGYADNGYMTEITISK